MGISAIAVFCGSKTGNNPLFEEHTRQLGHLLAEKNISIIYGGGNKGLMAAVANAALEKNGKVIGIIPELLKDREHMHEVLTELHIIENMHSRKKMFMTNVMRPLSFPAVTARWMRSLKCSPGTSSTFTAKKYSS